MSQYKSEVVEKMEKVNIHKKLSRIDEYWSQEILGEANGSMFKVAKGIGEINWHKHGIATKKWTVS